MIMIPDSSYSYNTSFYPMIGISFLAIDFVLLSLCFSEFIRDIKRIPFCHYLYTVRMFSYGDRKSTSGRKIPDYLL